MRARWRDEIMFQPAIVGGGMQAVASGRACADLAVAVVKTLDSRVSGWENDRAYAEATQRG